MSYTEENWHPNAGHLLQEVYKGLLGQDVNQWFFRTNASRLVVIAWLMFALIVGVAYRSNLTAFLMRPIFPPRPETIEELVQAVDR